MPHGRPLSAGSYVRLPRLAGVLEAGLLNFYHGNLSQEIVDEVTDIHIQTGMTLWVKYDMCFSPALPFTTKVQANGGVLSREDIGNYSVDVELPIDAQYNDKGDILHTRIDKIIFIFFTSSSAVCYSCLRVYNSGSSSSICWCSVAISSQLVRGTPYQQEQRNRNSNTPLDRWGTGVWIPPISLYIMTCCKWQFSYIGVLCLLSMKALKTALAMASGLGDPNYNSSVTEALSDMLR